MRRVLGRIIFGVALVLCVGGLAFAGPLYLTQHPPDITSGYIQVDYDKDTLAFTASGYAINFDIDGTAPPDYDIDQGSFTSTFDITALIDHSGTASSGSLNIRGMIPALGANSGSLLTGSLMRFGFLDPPGGDIFEFVFTMTGGDLSSYYPYGSQVILDANGSGFAGSFAASFSNEGFGNADTFPAVPEPGTAALAGIGLLLAGVDRLARCRRRT